MSTTKVKGLHVKGKKASYNLLGLHSANDNYNDFSALL